MKIKDPRKPTGIEDLDKEIMDEVDKAIAGRAEDLTIKNDLNCGPGCPYDEMPILSLEEATQTFMKLAREGGERMTEFMELLHRTPRDLRSIWMTWLIGITVQRVYSPDSPVAEKILQQVVPQMAHLPAARHVLRTNPKPTKGDSDC